MLLATPYRAIDGQDSWVYESVGMGHQHFWIIPEEWGERQPRLHASGHYAIACFSRLDNRDTLESDLDLDPHADPPYPDSELVLQAYFRWGLQCVDHLLGDFAFVIWDGLEQSVFLARDPLGAMDLCYALQGSHFLAASEPSQILGYPGFQSQLDETKIADYLDGFFVDQESTFFTRIKYLQPAHCLLVTAEKITTWRYWDIDISRQIRYRDERQYTEHFRELLVQAVRSRLRAVGPTGISLSGGLDSTSLAAIAARIVEYYPDARGSIKTFSSVFETFPTADERRFIEPLVAQLDLAATYLPGDDDWPLKDLDTWPVYRDSPVQDPFVLLSRATQQAASEAGCRVLFLGAYGDALYTGGTFWAASMFHDLRLSELTQLAWSQRGQYSASTDLLHYGLRALIPHRLKMAYRTSKPRSFAPDHPGLDPGLAGRSHLAERKRLAAMSISGALPGVAERYRYLLLNGDAESITAQRQLGNQDQIELVYPYFDRPLVEFIMAVPADQLYRPGARKRILRNTIQGWMPESVRLRDEVTSLYPLFQKGILEKETENIRHLLLDSQIVRRGLVRPDWLVGEYQPPHALTDEGYWLWLCLSLEIWLRKYWAG
jgi:asparagine synthase (glutamine-hydrolysing)